MLYDWDPKKNEFLKATRKISFEAIIIHLGRGDVWRVADHPDQAQYPGQQLFFVIINDYVYIVPFEIREGVIWLVTIILKTEMAEGESAAVIGPTRLPAPRVASSYRCNRCEPESLVEPSTTPSSSLSIPVSRIIPSRKATKAYQKEKSDET